MESLISTSRTGTTVMYKTGYFISMAGSFLILFWIGVYKFTAVEAEAIRPLMEQHPLLSWMYSIFTIQQVSNIIGITEVLLALVLVLNIKWIKLRKIASIGMIITFVLTLSFLFTTSGMWKFREGIPTTDFFILKDLLLLGFGLMLPYLPSPVRTN
ncbi:DUF417 family protein [Sphingobacterium spiritivorum]|uniref:DUF417 family protein n=1 Tax=Sphingobacterium spiritivorum TaxID=258 RepID=UPI003DA57AAF